MVAPRDLRQAFISGDEWAIESIDADGLAGALFAGDPGHSGGIEEWAQMERVAPDVVSTYRSLADAARTWLNDGYPLPDGPARS